MFRPSGFLKKIIPFLIPKLLNLIIPCGLSERSVDPAPRGCRVIHCHECLVIFERSRALHLIWPNYSSALPHVLDMRFSNTCALIAGNASRQVTQGTWFIQCLMRLWISLSFINRGLSASRGNEFGPSHRAAAGSGCTSIKTPSAPAAMAALAKWLTNSL